MTVRRQWRDYRTATGARPVVRFLDKLTDEDYALILVEMARVREHGLRGARHLRGDIYEVRVDGADTIFRVLFAKEGRYGQVLLSLDAFAKKSQKTPPTKVKLAEQRLRDWRTRGQLKRTRP